MTLPGDVPIVLTLQEDDDVIVLQEWVRSEVPHLGAPVDYHVDLVPHVRYDEPPMVVVTVFAHDGVRRKLIDLDDALREVARVMLQ